MFAMVIAVSVCGVCARWWRWCMLAVAATKGPSIELLSTGTGV